MVAPLRALALAFAFLTRLPAPPLVPRDGEVGRSMAFFPLVGLALGALLAGLGLLTAGLSPALQAALAVALLAALTGALHLDGLADCCDGMGVFGDADRRLAAMRDPRLGAAGGAGLAIAIVVKVLALAEAGPGAAAVLLPALALSRWIAALAAVAFPYARPAGTGREFARSRAAYAVLGGAFALAAVAWAGAWLPALGAAAAALVLALHMRRLLGGLTGDVYGAAVEIAEIAFFVMAALTDVKGR